VNERKRRNTKREQGKRGGKGRKREGIERNKEKRKQSRIRSTRGI
jgi:hypothetical protein